MKFFRNVLYRLTTGFTRINETARIKRLGRDEYQYCDGDQCYELQIDMLSGAAKRQIYLSTIKKTETELKGEPISLEQKLHIAKNVKHYLDTKGLKAIILE